MKIKQNELRKIIRERLMLAERGVITEIGPLGIAGAISGLAGAVGLGKKGYDYVQDKKAEEAAMEDASPDAYGLWKAMKGMGTDNDAVYKILNKVGQSSNPKATMKKVYDDFTRLTAEKGEDGMHHGDLVRWLFDDGLTRAAAIVHFLVNGVVLTGARSFHAAE